MLISASQCRMARAALGMSMRELAAAAGVSVNTLSRIEGDGNVTSRTLAKVQEILAQSGGSTLTPVPESASADVGEQARQATKGKGSGLAWPGLLRRLDRAQQLLPRPLAHSSVHVAVALEALQWRGKPTP